MKYDFHFVLFFLVLCCCSNNSPAVVTAFPQPSEDFENGIFNGNSTALPAVSNFSLDENSTAVPGNLFKNFTQKNKTVKKSKKKTKKNKTPKRTDTKAAIAQALAATNRTRRHVSFAFGMASNSTQKLVNLTRRVDPQKVVVFCRKHQVRVTMAMAVIAFHREIYQILHVLGWQILTKPAYSQEQGKWIRIRRSISPVAVLKVIVVVDLIRRYHANSNKERSDAGGDDDDENSSFSPFATAAALLLGRRGNPAVALLLSKFLAPSNSAYVPPVRQHYTFERLNERYTKDCYALDKVLNVKTVKPKTNSTKITDLFVGARKTASETDTNYTETVIIMDLTGLDTSVSSMETLRDEVTFVLTAYQKHQDDQPPLEVVVLLESPGGSAADYSLASQQLMRLRNKGIPLTICVDKVAASGEFRMLWKTN